MPLRYPKGTHEGGEFRPRAGVGHPIRRAVLRELVPSLPHTPKQRRHIRRLVSLDGRIVNVPEQRSFSRRIGGHLFTSPSGSSLVYRDGRPYVPPPGARQTVPALELPPVLRPEFDSEPDRADHDAALRLAQHALEVRRPDLNPAAVGASGWPTDTALRDAGFHESGFNDAPKGMRFSYVAPDGVSTLSVTYSKSGASVAEVAWTPRTPPAPGPLLDRPPRTWEEFTSDLDSYARQQALDHGRHAVLGTITTNPDFDDHAGIHHWDGAVELGPQVQADLAAAAAARARTGKLTEVQKRRVYAATQSGIHEMLHAASPAFRPDYDGPGMVLEEGLTEELARLETVKALRRQGQDDVVQWVADHPTDPRVLGTYLSYRHAIDTVLNDAKLAPELREQMIVRLKYADPPDRIPTLAAAVARAQSIPRAEAEQRVIDTLNRSAGTGRDWDGVPMLTAAADPSGDTAPHELGGVPVVVGDRVHVMRRAMRHGDWESWRANGTVIGISDTDTGWLLDVRYEHNDTDYGVLPRQVQSVESAEPGNDRVSFGVAADGLRLDNGDTIRAGDTVRYDGRTDGGYSEARVVRIVRETNPNGDTDNTDWVIEAIATARSLSPGQRVVLTRSRTGSQIEKAGTGDVPNVGGGKRRTVQPLTLERKARLARDFRMPPGTQAVALPQIVAADQPRPSSLRTILARFGDPAGEKMPTPVGLDRADGRVELDGALVHAAEQAGLTHLPVQVDRQWRTRARHVLERDLDAFEKHKVACPSDEFCHARIAGTQEALSIIKAGGGQEQILERAAAFGPLKGGSDRNEGFQTAMRNAWMTMETARELPTEVYGARQYAWPSMTPGANPDMGEREDAGMAEFYRRRSNPKLAERWERAARAAHAAGARQEPPDWESLFIEDDDSEKNSNVKGGWQQKVYGSGGSGSQTGGSAKQTDELLDVPVPFVPTEMKSRERALVRDPEGNEFIATWGTKQGQMFLDPKGGPLAKASTPVADLPELMYLGKPASQSWSPPPPPKPVWDDAHTVLTTKRAGGTNDAMFAEAADGTKWLVKRYRGDENRIATELLSNAIYRKLGVRVPQAGQLTFDGKAALGYPLLEGESKRWKGADPTLARGFMADALLANWDVVGLDQDNVLWDPDGEPFRVDQGGTLLYRAQGQRKSFGPVPSEVWTMNSPDGQAFGRMAITDGTKRQGASKIASTLKPAVVDELVDAAPFTDEKMREEVREALKARVAWMGDYAAGRVSEPKPLTGLGAAEALADGRSKVTLSPEQEVAVSALRGGWTPVLNEYLRTGKPKVASKRQLEFLARELEVLTKATRAPSELYAYAIVRLPADKDPEGLELRDRGFMPLSLARPPAAEGETVVRVLVPKGAPLLYLAVDPDEDAERHPSTPDLVLGRGTRLKLVAEVGGMLQGLAR